MEGDCSHKTGMQILMSSPFSTAMPGACTQNRKNCELRYVSEARSLCTVESLLSEDFTNNELVMPGIVMYVLDSLLCKVELQGGPYNIESLAV